MLKRVLLLVCALVLFATGAYAQKTLVFASDATWPPMEMLNTKKEIVGFTPELLVAMGKAGGFTPVIKNTAWDGIFAGLMNGKYDAVASSVSITEKRKKVMAFSEPYFEVKQGVITRKGSSIRKETDLKNKTAGAQINTTGFFALKKIQHVKVKGYDEVGLAIEDLTNGRLDAVVCDDATAADYALQNPNYSKSLQLAFLIIPEEPEYLGFAVQKDDKETLQLINKALAAVKASGEYDKIFNAWFSTQ